MTEHAPPTPARFIWPDPGGADRNVYTLFRKTFDLRSLARAATLHLFADTRYRLIVNGVTLGHGPARFHVRRPEYDTYNLAPHLRTGRNAIAVMVNSVGGVTFQSEVSIGGLIAWGEVVSGDGDRIGFTTDGSWKAMRSHAFAGDTPYLSFALNPGEHVDARALPPDWTEASFDDRTWRSAAEVENQQHWGPLRPRSIPMLDESVVRPASLLSAWVGRPIADEDAWSFRVVVPGGQGLHTRASGAAMAYLHSPREQEVSLAAWWGKYWLNGEPLTETGRDDAHQRRTFVARLRAGANTLLITEPSINRDTWEVRLGLPRSAQIRLSAEALGAGDDAFLIAGPWTGDATARLGASPLRDPSYLPAELGPWRRLPAMRTAGSAFAERAWLALEPISVVDSANAALRQARDGRTVSLVYDFGGEALGRPVIEFTAGAGTCIDLGYHEKLGARGAPDATYSSVIQMAERCVAREGRQRWHVFHPRGMRYLEVLLTPPPEYAGDFSAIELHDIALTRARYPAAETGWFRCSDPLLTRIWDVGQDTLRACMEDAYLDCPHRERGLYVADTYVQFLVNAATLGGTELFVRCIRLLFDAQDDTGLAPPGAHGLPAGRHPDFSALLPVMLHAWWEHTGDIGLLRELLPGLRKLLRGIESLRPTGAELLEGDALLPYIDAALADKRRCHATLNLFYQRCFHDASRLFALLGEGGEVGLWRNRADALAAAIRDAFWDKANGVFVDRRSGEMSDTHPSVRATALAILWGVATAEQAERALPWLVHKLAHNFRKPEPNDREDCGVSTYFSFFALAALFQRGRAEDALAYIRQCWGSMLDRGAWTWWENFWPTGIMSLCHAWSASPTYFLTRHVLGVSLATPGDLSAVRIAPAAPGIDWAEGTVPHPAGPIRVSWRHRGEHLDITCDAPPGVRVFKMSEPV